MRFVFILNCQGTNAVSGLQGVRDLWLGVSRRWNDFLVFC